MNPATMNSTTTACGICGGIGAILTSVHPVIPALEGLTAASSSIPPGSSCGELDALAGSLWSRNETACSAFRIAFSDECCEHAANVVDNNGNNNVERSTSAFVPNYQCEQTVHSALLGDESGYVSTAVPSRTYDVPLNVSVAITFYHATELSTKAGTAELFFGFHLTWFDERLVWDPAAYGGCDRIVARASLDAEQTELWAPPFDLKNRISGVQELPEASATVRSDGKVDWFRLGGVKAICMFEGLERFPYDELECEFVFASDLVSSPVKYILDPDALFAYPRIAKYQEFTLLRDRTTVKYTGTQDAGQIRLGFVFERSSRTYTRAIVVPTIIFTFVSFGMFLLDVRSGERLGFGVTLLLVVVANYALSADMLPVCSERIWINTVTMSSFYWIMAALIESILVTYLFFLETEERTEEKEDRERRTESCHCDEGGGGQGNDLSLESSLSNEQTPVNESNGEGPRQQRRKGLHRILALRHFWTAAVQPASYTSRIKTIRAMDRTCLIVFPVSYIIFFSTMFARNKYW